MKFIINDISISDRVYKVFSEQMRVTLITILLHDINDSDLQLCMDILSAHSRENWCY